MNMREQFDNKWIVIVDKRALRINKPCLLVAKIGLFVELELLVARQMFPAWERDVPTLGIKCSHVGNKVFPRWEYITSLGVEMVWSKRYLVETKWKVSEKLVKG